MKFYVGDQRKNATPVASLEAAGVRPRQNARGKFAWVRDVVLSYPGGRTGLTTIGTMVWRKDGQPVPISEYKKAASPSLD